MNESDLVEISLAANELTDSQIINGREFTINNVNSGASAADNYIEINTTGLDFPDDDFSLAETDLYVMSGESETVEAFFEGAESVYDGATDNFNSKRVVLREKSSAGKHFYTNSEIIAASSNSSGIFSNFGMSSI